MIKEISPIILGRGKFCQVFLDCITYDAKAEKCYMTVEKVGRPFLGLDISSIF